MYGAPRLCLLGFEDCLVHVCVHSSCKGRQQTRVHVEAAVLEVKKTRELIKKMKASMSMRVRTTKIKFLRWK
jgi:hypothetical protein